MTERYDQMNLPGIVIIMSLLSLLFGCEHVIADEHMEANPKDRLVHIEAFADEAAAQVPGMAVIVALQDQVIFRKASGFSDLEHGVRLRPEDPFRIGSLTKQFTAVAILQLADQGKLSLDDELSKLLPDFPTGGRRITISQLLSHTSGIPDYTDTPGWQQFARQDRTPTQLLSLVRDKPAVFEPGSNWNYSNTNYAILGAVIEKVTGEPYGDYLKSHLFVPAGMTGTTYDDAGAIVLHRVRGYTRVGQERRNADFVSISAAYAAGGLLSNVDDLWKWEQSLAAGKLIPRERLVQARSENKLADGRGTGYGFGWAVGTLDGHATAEHGGRIPGFQSYCIRASDAGVFVAVLYNTDEEAAKPDRLALRITRALLDDRTTSLPTTPADVMQYVGTYLSATGTKITLIADKDMLTLDEEGRRRPLTRVGDGEFVSWRDARRFRFRTDEKGLVRTLIMHPRLGAEQRFTRGEEPRKH